MHGILHDNLLSIITVGELSLFMSNDILIIIEFLMHNLLHSYHGTMKIQVEICLFGHET